MATPTGKTAPKKTLAEIIAGVQEHAKPFLVPYYLTVAAVLGAITTVFVVMTIIIVVVATNFNVLGLIE